MDGQIVLKNEPFEMVGKDGKTYYPQYPRDPILPVGETANCHCFAQDVLDTDMKDKPLKERQELQSKAVEDDDAAWEKELDERNKAKAGINEDAIKIDWLKAKPEDEQIRYFGSKNRWALFKSGVIQTDADLERLFMIKPLANGKTSRVRKPLKELTADGIMTVSSSAVKHSTIGEFSGLRNPNKPAGGKNGGNMKKGGHSQANIDYLESKGIEYKIEKTYKNGVRIGGVANQDEPDKRLGQTGQAWFPEDWSEDDVLVAGTYVANRPEKIIELKSEGTIIGYKKYSQYNGVTVGIITDAEGNAGTIFPDTLQRKVADIND